MHRFELNNPIQFGEHSLRGLYDLLNGPDGVDVDTNVAEFLAAAVDAVKSPILNFLNLRTLNAGAGVMLARLGYSTTDIGLLFNQPIIKEALDYA